MRFFPVNSFMLKIEGCTHCGVQCPTTVIPFFGDQPFWGDRVHEKGVGPVPIPVNHFTLEKLVNAIEFMLDPKVCFRWS